MKGLFLAGLLFAGVSQAATYYVTIAGIGGEPEYDQRFTSWAKDIDKILRATPDAQVETLYGAASTKAKFESVLREIATKAKPDDGIVIMLIGHGSFDGTDYKINLPGPDLSAGELAALLNKLPAKRQLVVNMTSASGGSLQALQRENRVIVTATKSGSEKNATIFARYWVEALRDPSADADKNEVITALEAFKFAEAKTVKFYESQNRIATEHALMEDTGKGEAVRAPSPANGQGLVAGRFPVLKLGAEQAKAATPERQALLKKKEELELQVDQLKYQKAATPTGEYRARMSGLLLELSKVQAELDK
jgi:hypothetical protein